MSATITLGHFGLGQSNYWGKGSFTYPIISQCYRVNPSGELTQLGPGNMLISNFTDDPLNIGNRENTTYSLEGALLDALQPIQSVHVAYNCASNGTTSTQWATDLTTSPIVLSSVALIEAAKIRMLDFLSRPNTMIGGIFIYQGESNSIGTATPAQWLTDWRAIRDELNIFIGSRFAFSKPYGIIQLPPTYPTDLTIFGGNNPDWQAVRTNQAIMAADPDCFLIPSADPIDTVPGENYHLETLALVALGTLAGQQFVANNT